MRAFYESKYQQMIEVDDDFIPISWNCTCMDFVIRRAGNGTMCKHILKIIGDIQHEKTI